MMKEIFSRRSVRKFTGEAVSPEQLEKLLRAAMCAPSAGNQQPWEFIVVRNRETMGKIQVFHPYSRPLDTAACAIVVCGDTTRQRYPGFWVQDCSAAIQNLLLESVHLGLGGVWMGVYPSQQRVQDCQELFRLPQQIIPLGIVALGYPDEQPQPRETYQPQRIHWESWEEV